MRSFAKWVGPRVVAIVTSLLFPSCAFAQPDCKTAPLDTVCKCDLVDLKPLQGAVGLREVKHKQRDISGKVDDERSKLAKDPIKVVAGPEGFYITDHHHTALAWLRAKTKWGTSSLCEVHALRDDSGRPQSFHTEEDFWAALKAAHLVWLKDEHGTAIRDPHQLPSLEGLAEHDDPYRSLAWKVRDKGFCRPACNKEFLEFQWADFFRSHQDSLPVKTVDDWSSKQGDDDAVVEIATKLAVELDEAKNLVGYKPKGTECSRDP